MAFWTSPPVLKIMLQDAVGSLYSCLKLLSRLFCLWCGDSMYPFGGPAILTGANLFRDRL
jgi:hypothetical protein